MGLLDLIVGWRAETFIRIQGGDLIVKRGHLLSHARQSVAELLKAAGVTSGYIAIEPGRRVKFSRTIPAAIHQRLRNVLLNP